MKITTTRIAGLSVLEAAPFADNRGSFARLFCARELGEIVAQRSIAQINVSRTRVRGAVRGLHYQKAPHAEMKLVSCLQGRVWDVAVDLRSGSPTYLQWHSEELSPENRKTMVIPEGCAHGFQVLDPDSELLYLHTAFYEPSAEGGIRPTEPLLNIPWPLPIVDLSVRDQTHPLLSPEFAGLHI
jgi:dTDP-4-dehydrorhamnose 3,5-epimerase